MQSRRMRGGSVAAVIAGVVLLTESARTESPPAPPGAAVAVTTFTQSTPVAINDLATSTSTIDVSGLDPYLHDLDMTTHITHTWNADLDITLTSPAGTTVTITTGNGGSADNVFNGTLWDDSADNVVTDHAYSNMVTATPLVPEEALAAFIGENPNGTWTITIFDNALQDQGTLHMWSLDVTNIVGTYTTLSDRIWLDENVNGIQDPGEPGLSGALALLYDAGGVLAGADSTDGNGNYSFVGIPAGDYRVEFILPPGYLFTASHQGASDEMDSDADPVTGQTPLTAVAEGEVKLSVDAGLAPDDFLTLGLNRGAFGTSDTLTISALLHNGGADLDADLYFGFLLPDGDTVLFFTDSSFNFGLGSASDLTTIEPILPAEPLAGGFVGRFPVLFEHTWAGTEPGGSYTAFVAALVPGALADGVADPGEVLGFSSQSFTYTP